MRLLACSLVLAAACGDDLEPTQRILFIHGGAGTGGFVEGGADEHLSSIHDDSIAGYNHGFGQLADMLEGEGYVLEERAEGPADDNTPVDLSDLARFSIVVFGSNNARYEPEAVARVADFVFTGGGALFISDGNWGSFWDKAPGSDQQFLDSFGMTIHQDGGGLITIDASEFLVPDHPVLQGVTAFEGEGVSPCRATEGYDRVRGTLTRLAPTKGVVKRNTAPDGPVEDSTDEDGALWVLDTEEGRVACHYDRNTFFNENGAGTSLALAGNRTYAANLFAWLARRI